MPARKILLPLILGLIGLTFLVYGLISSSTSHSANDSIAPETLTMASDIARMKISIDISGAVVSPGVYALPAGSRVLDGLKAAGGLSTEADSDWVAKNLNLATVLKDADKLYLPKSGEVISTKSGSRLININTASQDELDSLPGVGLSTAKKIVDARPYSAIEELVAKKVVGQTLFQKIKDQITTR